MKFPDQKITTIEELSRIAISRSACVADALQWVPPAIMWLGPNGPGLFAPREEWFEKPDSNQIFCSHAKLLCLYHAATMCVTMGSFFNRDFEDPAMPGLKIRLLRLNCESAGGKVVKYYWIHLRDGQEARFFECQHQAEVDARVPALPASMLPQSAPTAEMRAMAISVAKALGMTTKRGSAGRISVFDQHSHGLSTYHFN